MRHSATARTAVTGGTGLAALFEAQVRADPRAAAYVCGDAVVSFGELRSRVHGLAHRLRALGVGPDVPVGLYLPRSIDSAVGLLAILAAGGGYVPLDPGYPVGQVEHMLGDTRARAVVTSPELSGSLPRSAPAVFVDGPAASFAPVATAPWHLSHIMYTSGSTGAPKGVLVPQRQLLNRFSWMWRRYPFGADDVLCQRSGVGFSVSMWEFLGGLLRGIPTVLVPASADRDPVELLDTLHRHRVTRVTVVPSLLRVLLSIGRSPLLPHVRQWTVCGEPLTRELYDRLLLATPAAQVCVDYGTTETNGFLWNDTGRSPSPRPTVPVGRPAADMSVSLLDGSGQPVPPGEPGYVHVRGPGLARGYLNQPDLTADRFGPAGFRPGDLARLVPGEGYEFVGRTDNQVKIHGVRVELEGVEAHLREHPSVAHAVAAAPDGVLVAHVVAAPGADRDPAALRRFLATRLPPAAVPTRYAYTEAIPV
ncbi:MAG: amino acid adenylation domain-containing protein, partial [Natronosporangium sp.]